MTGRLLRITRLLRKNSIINILGLSIGVAAFVIILLEEILDAITAPPPPGPAIISECPEVKCFVRFFTQDESIITIENQKFVEDRLSYE